MKKAFLLVIQAILTIYTFLFMNPMLFTLQL